MKFYIVDAFTNEIFGGNPAGVVLTEGRNYPPFDIMQKTAAELGFSETAFIRESGGNKYELRYITPTDEVDLCGHATIASFTVIGKESKIQEGETRKYIAVTKAGEIKVDVTSESVMMDMAKPEIIQILDNPELKMYMRRILGLDGEYAASMEPAIVSTGLPDIIFPVNSEEELNKINVDFNALTELSKDYKAVGIHTFALPDLTKKTDESKYIANCRNFAPLYGIPEEAATGTSNGALTYYLFTKDLIKKGEYNSIIQGVAMGRPSEIVTLAEDDTDGNIKIRVGGPATVLSEGEILL